MRTLVIMLILFILTNNISANNKKRIFDSFCIKFTTAIFPISKQSYDSCGFYNNDSSNISKCEFDYFIKDNVGEFWKYQLVSSNYDDYFIYRTGVKFDINEKFIALIYLCSYIGDYSECQYKIFLSIFDFKGNIISTLPIEGGSDDLNFNSNIYSPNKIEIYYTLYNNDTIKKYIELYYIKEDGTIINESFSHD